tara:strand:+ start:319 stop:603 length:285 start_codon:yes stop_codon:yes gene_type:complete
METTNKGKQMTKYEITINETTTSKVIVRANSIDEARDIINTGHYNVTEEISKSAPKIQSCYVHIDEIPLQSRYMTIAPNILYKKAVNNLKRKIR